MKLPRLVLPPNGKHHKLKAASAVFNDFDPEIALQGGAPFMADMTTHQMLDDVNLAIEEKYAADAFAIAAYVNGRYANWPAVVAKYGRSGKFLLSIDVQGNPADGAQCLDVETGDAKVSQAPLWVKVTQAAGKAVKDLRYFPKVYASAGNLAALTAAMEAAKIARDEYMIWSAHYTGEPHICGPKTCGYPQADATQWTSDFDGVSLDASLCYGYFFAGPPAVDPPKPEPKPPVVVVKPPVIDPPKPVEPPRPPVVDPPDPVPVEPPKPVIVAPEPSPEPEPVPVGKPEVLVYVQEVLGAEFASKIGLPAGTIVFIPHKVQGA